METLLTIDDVLLNASPVNVLPDGYNQYEFEVSDTVYFITAKFVGWIPTPARQSGKRPTFIIRSYMTS